MKEGKGSARRKDLEARALVVAVLFMTVPASSLAAEVSGRMLAAGGAPLAGGAVLLFRAEDGAPPPMPERYFRMPDITAPLDGEGRFHLTLQGGTYYLGAMRRSGENRPGPLQNQDLFFTLDGEDGNPRVLAIPAAGRMDIGEHAGGRELGRIIAERSGKGKKASGAAESFPAPAWQETSVRGTVQDLNGTPVADVWVWALFTSPGEPARQDSYVSFPTGKDGAYTLLLPGSGTYQLTVGSPGFSRRLVTPGAGGEALPKAHQPVSVEGGQMLKDLDLAVQ